MSAQLRQVDNDDATRRNRPRGADSRARSRPRVVPDEPEFNRRLPRPVRDNVQHLDEALNRCYREVDEDRGDYFRTR